MNLRGILQNDLRHFDFDTDLKSDPLWADSSTNHADLPRIKEGHLGGQVSEVVN